MLKNDLIKDITPLMCGITLKGLQIKEAGGWVKHLVNEKPKTNLLGLTSRTINILAGVATIGLLPLGILSYVQTERSQTLTKEKLELIKQKDKLVEEKDSLARLLKMKELEIQRLDSLNKGK